MNRMDWLLDRVVFQSHDLAFVGNTMVTDSVFDDGTAILAEWLEVLVLTLKALCEEANLLGLHVSWERPKYRRLEAC